MAKGPFIWEAHEYVFQEKTSDWYWAVGIVVVSVAVLVIIFGNLLLALLILLSGFVLALFASKKPDLVRFEVSKKGIMIDKTLYPYGTLDSFWVEDNDHLGFHSKLLIKSQKVVMPLIVIPLEGTNPEEVRDFLLDHLLEEHHSESIGKHILERLGF